MILLMVFTIIIALIFDLVNGFHDAANSVATIVSTRVLKPGTAVLWSAFFTLLAMFLFAPRVADTIAKIVKIQPNDIMYMRVVLAGLLGAIAWDLITWWFGLPTSSSHALIGGISGAGVTYSGWDVLEWDKLLIILLFIFLAPCIGFLGGFILRLIASWALWLQRPFVVDQWFRRGQLISAALYSIGHGANDAQKTMGVIVALLIAAGALSPETQLSLMHTDTLWIILSCQFALALGTALGGWRIVKTMGMQLTPLKPVGGFCAETAGALTLFLATSYGIPVSTTHVICGSIIGVGTCTAKYNNVQWGLATRLFWSWILTIPASALCASLLFFLMTAI